MKYIPNGDWIMIFWKNGNFANCKCTRTYRRVWRAWTKPNWHFCVHLANQVDVKLTFLFRIGHSNHHLHHRIFAFLAVTMWQNKYEIGFSTVVIIACPNMASTFGMCQFWRYNCRHCATCAVCPWARSVCIITWICYHPYQCAQRLRVRQHCCSLKS